MDIKVRYRTTKNLHIWMDSVVTIMQSVDLDLLHDRVRDALIDKEFTTDHGQGKLFDYYIEYGI